jgi:uncharacterized protein YjiS (DUF1127 family)
MHRHQATAASPTISRARSSVWSLLAWLQLCRERRRQRLALAKLGAHLLKDIGLTPADVRQECAKPFWR